MIRSLSQFGRQFVQPTVAAVRLDVREGLAVHPRRAVVETTTQVGELQDVSSVHLVVQPVKPVTGRFLRFGMQRRLSGDSKIDPLEPKLTYTSIIHW